MMRRSADADEVLVNMKATVTARSTASGLPPRTRSPTLALMPITVKK